MRFFIVETRVPSGGHEMEFDRIFIEELRTLGHNVTLALPRNVAPKLDYGVEIYRLSSQAAPLPVKGSLPARLLRSLKSESRRQNIYAEIANLSEEYDCVVFPTATYRFLRALRLNKLKNSKKAVVFIVLGATPLEARKILGQARRLKSNENIHSFINTINKDQEPKGEPNVHLVPPPAYIPRGVPWRAAPGNRELVFGFFGLYRREKKLPQLLDGILAAKLTRPVKFHIQAFAGTPLEQEEVEELAKTYGSRDPRLTFLTRSFAGADWQEALLNLDALLLPYDSERFKWHWSGMLFNAIGFSRPVLAAKTINPEVWERFPIGETFSPGDSADFARVLEDFVDNFDANAAKYSQALAAALEYYHPRRLAKSIEAIAEKCQ